MSILSKITMLCAFGNTFICAILYACNGDVLNGIMAILSAALFASYASEYKELKKNNQGEK